MANTQPCSNATTPVNPRHEFRDIAELYSYVKSLRALSTSPSNWEVQSRSVLECERYQSIAHSCPFTRRAYQKPRGYAGDAPTLDYIYGIESDEAVRPEAGTTSESVFNFTTNIPATRAVRYRRRLLAGLSDETARKNGNAKVLSIASGHLREIELSEAARRGQICEWRAFDQDIENVRFVRAEHRDLGAVAQHGSIRSLIGGETTLGRFHFTYTAGLLDYLNDLQAESLIGQMINSTHKNGVVLVANFLPDIPDRAFMETFMNWNLIYRDAKHLRSLFETRWSACISDLKMFTDPDENIVFAKAIVD